MNRHILYIAIPLIILSSCSTAYKAGQTPDDLYYSPGDGIVAAPVPTSNDSNTTYVQPAPSIFYTGIVDPNYCDYAPYYHGYIYDHYSDPYYYKYPVYNTPVYVAPYVNHTPRMVNLNGYKTGFNNSNVAASYTLEPQTVQTVTKNNTANPPHSTIGSRIQQLFSAPPAPANDNSNTTIPSYNNNNSSNNNNYNNSNSNYSAPDRSYSPSSSSSSGEISRPERSR